MYFLCLCVDINIVPLNSKFAANFVIMKINGYSVDFPKNVKPFPTQIAVMNKIITALKRKQHALIESPTGTGKTLSILSSVLSWYVETRENNLKEMEEEINKSREISPQSITENMQTTPTQPVIPRTPERLSNVNSDDDFETPPLPPDKLLNPIKYDVETQPIESSKPEGVKKFKCQIFYLTRTHSQIKQVVKEFKRTPYSSQVKMTILSSREQSCINPKAKNVDKNEFCKNMLKNGIII